MDITPTPDRIMQIGMGFWSSKTLLVAVELGLLMTIAAKMHLVF